MAHTTTAAVAAGAAPAPTMIYFHREDDYEESRILPAGFFMPGPPADQIRYHHDILEFSTDGPDRSYYSKYADIDDRYLDTIVRSNTPEPWLDRAYRRARDFHQRIPSPPPVSDPESNSNDGMPLSYWGDSVSSTQEAPWGEPLTTTPLTPSLESFAEVSGSQLLDVWGFAAARQREVEVVAPSEQRQEELEGVLAPAEEEDCYVPER
ncbi:hypothetical protein RhiJN_10526 [Ceratobasidium sp. AG-Ba]|nr:hypothetical protein RhiJN_10526 [Ceratobasidium sp. AG-Ba]QRW11260.1 hypothetical protein RhiLY_10259 [Ceratobasidium sp. AG-Ba]